ncbi:MAG: HEAT repeat domain-containing protein [Bacteroidales bacterium]
MNKKDITEIDISLKDFPDNISSLIRESLDSENSVKKLTARSTLVGMGKPIIPKLNRLLSSENSFLRMEAAKIVELIDDSRSIPFLINLLDDKEFEIRWIAAEGLIKIGRRSILPLLKSIRDGESSFIFNKGAHHVLNDLLNESQKGKLSTLLLSLDDSHELGETAPVEASEAIKTIFTRKINI